MLRQGNGRSVILAGRWLFPVSSDQEGHRLVFVPAAVTRIPMFARSARVWAAKSTALALALVIALAGLVIAAGGARADSSSSFVGMVNSARAAHGLPSLAVSSDLSAAARAQASRMAASRTLAHTPNLGGAVCCWSALGENVGEGPSASAIEAAFMNSAEHRANILSGSYTQIGVGAVVDSTGTLWVSEIFRRPIGAAPAPAPKPVVTHPAAPAAPTQHRVPIAKRPVAAATVATVRPPAAAAQPRASRDLARVSLQEAQRLAKQLDDAPGVQGVDPVSRLLDFVAINATLN